MSRHAVQKVRISCRFLAYKIAKLFTQRESFRSLIRLGKWKNILFAPFIDNSFHAFSTTFFTQNPSVKSLLFHFVHRAYYYYDYNLIKERTR